MQVAPAPAVPAGAGSAGRSFRVADTGPVARVLRSYVDNRYSLGARALWLVRQLGEVSRIAGQKHDGSGLAKCHGGQ